MNRRVGQVIASGAVGRGCEAELDGVELIAIEQDSVVVYCVPGEFQAMIEPSDPAVRVALIRPGAR